MTGWALGHPERALGQHRPGPSERRTRPRTPRARRGAAGRPSPAVRPRGGRHRLPRPGPPPDRHCLEPGAPAPGQRHARRPGRHHPAPRLHQPLVPGPHRLRPLPGGTRHNLRSGLAGLPHGRPGADQGPVGLPGRELLLARPGAPRPQRPAAPGAANHPRRPPLHRHGLGGLPGGTDRDPAAGSSSVARRLPIYITENGAAFDDPTPVGGQLQDPRRVDYLRDHLAAARAALEQGVDLRGYYAWSLLDNFEWSCGYAKRFGIVHVDFATQARTLKASGQCYRDFILRVRR